MNVRPIEDCISETTEVVVGMMCDSRFHKDVLGLTDEQSYHLTGVHVCDIRESVAKSYGSLKDAPTMTFDERIREMALRVSAARGSDLESCIASAHEVFTADHRVDLGPTCDEEVYVKPTLEEIREQLGPLL